LFSLADNRPAMAGLIFRSQITGRSRMNVQAQTRSPLIGFGSLQRNPTEPAFFSEAAGLRIIPLQRFADVPAVLGATPLRQRLTSFALATVDRTRSCVTGLILGGVPLSAPYDFGLVDSPVLFSVNEGPGRSTTLMGFWKPFAALILQSQGEAGSSPHFKPRVPFDERPPRPFFSGGSVAQIHLNCSFKRPTDQGRSFRLPGFALCPVAVE